MIFQYLFQTFISLSYAKELCEAASTLGLPKVAECRPLSESNVPYYVEVIPVINDQFTSQADVDIKIVGEFGQTKPIILATKNNGTIRRQTSLQSDIGDPKEVNVTFNSKDDSSWKCQKIFLRRDFLWWVFDCNGYLNSQNPSHTYSRTGNKIYTISLQTGNDENAGTKGIVEINLRGDVEDTGFKFLKQNINSGSQDVVSLRGADVGSVTSITLKTIAENDPWYCQFVTIRSDDGRSTHFDVRRWIGVPYDLEVTVDLNDKNVMDGPLIDLECFTRAIDIFAGNFDNPQIVNVRCPANCDHNAFAVVYGSGIHPSISSICQSAVLDNVLTPSGGNIVLTLTNAIPNYYEASQNLTEIKSREYQLNPSKSIYSFYSYLSYSNDKIDKDIRLVDPWNNLAAVGRLEIRKNGKWGAVCKKGEQGDFNEKAARLACQELGFLHGFIAPSGCGSIKGANGCALTGYHTAVAAIQCTGSETSILDCTYEEPPALCSDHTFDVAVQCTNFPPDREPPTGTIRIVEPNGAPSLHGIGRLEYYFNGWGTVCNDKFSKESESVVCKELGYSHVKNGGYSNFDCSDVQGVNYCGHVMQKINAINLACDGSETSVRSCNHETGDDIYCVHEEDIVVGCEGNGDPSGVGIYSVEEKPHLSMKPFDPFIPLQCGDKPSQIPGFQKEIGSSFFVKCPDNCLDDTAEVKGLYIYTDDSAVCRSAIHAGVIPKSGGSVTVIKTYGQDLYISFFQNGVNSTKGDKTNFAFLTAVVSSSVKSLIATNEIYHGVEMYQQLKSNPKPEKNVASSILPPLFMWCAQAQQTFKKRPFDFVDTETFPNADRLSSLRDFSVSFRAQVKGSQGFWRTVVAYTDCNGFNIAISPSNELVFEQICSKSNVNSKFQPRLNKWFSAVITYSADPNIASIYVDGKLSATSKTDFNFQFKTSLVVGKNSDLDAEYFDGDISFVRIFDYILSPDQVVAEFQKSEKPIEFCPRFVPVEKIRKRYTVDGRLCLTQCIPCEEAETKITDDVVQKHTIVRPSSKISCEETALSENFNGAAGDTFRVICPSGCINKKIPVYGYKIYAPESSICMAAILEGYFQNEGGIVLVTLGNGLSNYDGVLGKNNIESQPLSTAREKSFLLSEAMPPKIMNCSSTASFAMTMPLGTHILLKCPENCSKESSYKVYGSMSYTPNSAVCRAAIHAGVLTDNGGEVELVIQDEENDFSASLKNLIQSEKSATYLRSFIFAQTSEENCHSFASDKIGTNKTIQAYWNEIYFDNVQSYFIVDSVSSNVTKTKIGFYDYSNPALLLLQSFKCDHYNVFLTMTINDFNTVGGFVFAYKDKNNFLNLYANVTNPQGNGYWRIYKFFGDEMIPMTSQIPFKFQFYKPLYIHAIVNEQKIEAWASYKEKNDEEPVMIANAKDLTSENLFGQFGLSILKSPEKQTVFNFIEVISA